MLMHPHAALAFLFLVLALSASGQSLNLPPHPRLLLSREELPAVRARMAKQPWARAYFRELKSRCDARLEQPVTLPPRGGQWWHWYSCPKHGCRLRTESPTRHVCPIGGEVFTGYPYDDVVLSADHDSLAIDARDLGLCYQVTGDRRYADKAREILLDYAARYLSYPLHDINGKPRVGGGRVLPQTLDESIWLISMARAADLVWDTLSPTEIENLKTGLFYPAAVDVIQKHRMPIHNIQCWKNSAVGLVGLLFGDPALVKDAIDGPVGYRAQMAKGVEPDGAWFEGAWGYHFYTMSALLPLTEAAHLCGIDLYGDPLRRMFLAPIEMAMPDGRLPAFNDSGEASAAGNANYEIALARYGDPRFAEPLAKSSRRTLEAFVDGVDSLPPAPKEPRPSCNFTSSGYAILWSGRGSASAWLCLKYGPHGGGHGHPDKNSFVLYADGRVLAGDPGTALYGVPIQAGWYRTTLAHNTLTVDEESQQPATGDCLGFVSKRGWSAALTDAGRAIAGGTFHRAAFLIGRDVAVFLDTVQSEDGKAHRLDLAFHPSGAWASPLPGGSLALPDTPGYAYLRDVHVVTVDQGIRLSFENPAASRPPYWVAFAAASGEPTTFLTGTGVGANTEDRVPILIARRQSARAVYAWAVSLKPSDAPPEIAYVPVESESGADGSAAARVGFGGKTYLVIANPTGAAIGCGSYHGADKLAVVPVR